VRPLSSNPDSKTSYYDNFSLFFSAPSGKYKCSISNYDIINRKIGERKGPWPILRYYHSIFPEILRKRHEINSVGTAGPGRGLN
jgi:hypothetical protein